MCGIEFAVAIAYATIAYGRVEKLVPRKRHRIAIFRLREEDRALEVRVVETARAGGVEEQAQRHAFIAVHWTQKAGPW